MPGCLAEQKVRVWLRLQALALHLEICWPGVLEAAGLAGWLDRKLRGLRLQALALHLEICCPGVLEFDAE